MGVWIETAMRSDAERTEVVTPFVGVWIETPKTHKMEVGVNRHTLRGCVD